jgi:hypothetical protein
MSTRISSALALALTLAACSRAPAEVPAGEPVQCALGGSTTFKSDCTAERSSAQGKQLIVLHNPGGGFHRLEVVNDGRGVVAADGAHEIASALAGNDLEVAIDGDRYRLTARRIPDAKP